MFVFGGAPQAVVRVVYMQFMIDAFVMFFYLGMCVALGTQVARAFAFGCLMLHVLGVVSNVFLCGCSSCSSVF